MATYAGLGECTDPVVTVEESDLDAADVTVRRVLTNKGIDPADAGISADGLALLRALAIAEATAAAARRGAADGGQDSAMWAKQRAYLAEAMRLTQSIDRESLGLAVVGSGAAGFGSIPLGRG